MNTDNKKGIANIIFLIITLAIAAGGLILTKPSFFLDQNRKTVEPSPSATPTFSPTLTPTPSSTLIPSPTPTDKTTEEINGIFTLIHGDPLPGSGDQKPRYKYYITDDSGKTTEIKIDSSTKLIGGKSITDFNLKRVKVKGSPEDSKMLVATSIEIL